jgi:hypothetical protein
VFAGPSLRPTGVGLEWRGPAEHGDITRAVSDGATHIGFIDGLYDVVASVWHKEILAALAAGVGVLGGGSLGAIRAAECGPFGMEGVGVIHGRYASGLLDDDAAVAQLHAPAELGYAALTEALVNVEATLERLGVEERLPRDAAAALLAAAQRLFFKHRTHETIVEEAGFRGKDAEALVRLLDAGRVDLKRSDALALVERLRTAGPAAPSVSWRLAETWAWRRARAIALEAQ